MHVLVAHTFVMDLFDNPIESIRALVEPRSLKQVKVLRENDKSSFSVFSVARHVKEKCGNHEIAQCI